MRRREFIAAARRRGGGVAARGARAGAGAAHRRADVYDRRRTGIAGPHRGAPAGACRRRAGPLGATCGSMCAGAGAISRACAKTRRNWSRSARTCLVAGAGPTTGTLQQATRTVPIVFAQGLDPVGAGFVESLARPGGNATGFTQFEYGLSGKWLELLKEIAPQ